MSCVTVVDVVLRRRGLGQCKHLCWAGKCGWLDRCRIQRLLRRFRRDDLNRFRSHLQFIPFGLWLARLREVDRLAENFTELDKELRTFSDDRLHERDELITIDDFVIVETWEML